MKSFLVVAILVGALAVATAAPPVFANSYTSDTISAIQINQGGVSTPDGVCCPAESPECKVQTAFSAFITYNWFEGNKTAQKNPDGSGVVVDFNLMKEFAVTATGACQSYCPLQAGTTIGGGQFINPNATDEGTVTYNGSPATKWYSNTVIPILNVTMEYTDFYVSQGNPVMPIAAIQYITPFGQQIGLQNQTFASFTPGVPAAKHFTVTGIAKCPMSNQCQSNNDDGQKNDDMPSRRMSVEGEYEPSYTIVRKLGVGPHMIVME